jgi:hypothetical protein
MRLRPVPVLIALLVTISSPTWGQSARVGGVSIERFYFQGYRFLTVNYRRTDLRKGEAKSGMDLVLGFAPNALAVRTAVLQLEAGLARALPVGPGTLLLRGGMSNFLAVGPQSGLVTGLHGGLAALVPLENRASVRVDVTRHFYLGLGGGRVAMWSIGLGFAVGSPPLNR